MIKKSMEANMRKFCILLLLVLGVLFCLACGSGYIQDPVPPRLAYSDELFSVLKIPGAPEDASIGDGDVKYNIIVDSRIASGSGSSGYLRKNCYTFQQILSCMQSSIAGESYIGYFTCKNNKYAIDPETGTNEIIGVTNYVETNDLISRAVSATLPNNEVRPADVIKQIATEVNMENLYIFVTDLSMKNPSESQQIIDAINKGVIKNYNLTLGLIGIKADYSGTVCDIPISNMGVSLPETKIYQKPIYLFFVGEKHAVFEAMDNFLLASEGFSGLNSPEQIETLYYYKYDYTLQSETETSIDKQGANRISYSGRLATYLKEGYDPSYIISAIPDDSKIRSFINSISLSKMYSGVLNDENIELETDNIQFTFQIPFQLNSDIGTAKSKLLRSENAIDASALSLRLSEDISRIELRAQNATLQLTEPETVQNMELTLNTKAVDFNPDSNTICIKGDYNPLGLKLDEPTLYRVRITAQCALPMDVLADAYNIEWLNEWQMDLSQVQKEWGHAAVIDLVRKSPFIAEIFNNALYSSNIAEVQKYIQSASSDFSFAINFGLVLREKAQHYNKEKDWEETEDFGWAFSQADVNEMNKLKAVDTSTKSPD